MSWFSDKVEKLKSLPNPHIVLFVAAKVIGGIGIGVLLATWIAIWTWWIFIVLAFVIAIPVVWKLFSR